jgi:hypothetical protein
MISNRLRRELSINCSGKLNAIGKIEHLKEENYNVVDINLDGDAPKQFIKAYFHTPGGKVKKCNPASWNAFIAKTAEKWYPHESVIEYMINRIGEELGVKMNGIRLVNANGQIRFLSRYFLKPHEALIHGAEICGHFLEDMEFAARVANDKKTARELFTFEFIEQAIQAVFPNGAESILMDLVKMITFDAIIGNNDRHFYNWAVVRSPTRETPYPSLAPIYDSSRGLLWNLSDEKILTNYQNQKNRSNFVGKYIKNAYPRISIEGDAAIDHFGLLTFLKDTRPHFKSTIEEMTEADCEQRALALVENEFGKFFIPERMELTIQILKERFKLARAI